MSTMEKRLSAGNDCFSCGKKIKKIIEEEYITWHNDPRNKTYFCVPCGDNIIARENRKQAEENEKLAKKRQKEVQEDIENYFAVIGPLAQRLNQENIAGTEEDYKEIRRIQRIVNSLAEERVIDWFTKVEDPLIKMQIENLKNSCQNLINEYISPKIRKTVDVKHPIHKICCSPNNIKLEENDSESYYYCNYCWENESSNFLRSLQKYHLDNINKSLLKDNKHFDFNSNSNYKKLLTNNFTNQEEIQQVYQELVKELKTKGIDIPNQNDKDNPRVEREREREQNYKLNLII